MDIVRARTSVRTFDARPLTEEDRRRLQACIDAAENPYGIPVEFRFLAPEEYGLRSPVLSGETLYLAAKVKRVPHFEEAYGYSFEAVVLGAQAMGLGTVWIGGTMNRPSYERAMDLQADEVMPCVTPVGYPAAKRSIKEALMRKGVKADQRLPLSEIAFEVQEGGGQLSPLSSAVSDPFGEALEMIRWAPSAVNKQPWRIVLCRRADRTDVHFYEKPDKGYVGPATGDLQRIDIGIAMYHFVYGMRKRGAAEAPVLSCEDPHLSVPAGWQYTATYTVR